MKLEAVVLHVDLSAQCLELSLDLVLIKAVKNFKDNKYSQVRHFFLTLVVWLVSV